MTNRLCQCSAALPILVVLLATISEVVSAADVPVDLRVGCQTGQAPFNDVGHGGSGCHGLFFDVFKEVCARANITFNVTTLATDIIDPFIIPQNPPSTATELDALIAFHSVTPERMEYTDFSIVLYETGYTLVLSPSFHQPAGSITNSVIRESVLYIMSIMGTIIALYGIVVAVIETLTPGSEVASKPPWQRLLWGYEQAFETVVTGGMSLDAHNQATRSLRTIIAFIGFFLVNIFGALITSNLTASALGASTPTIADVRGTNIAVASPTLQAHLAGLAVGAKVTDVRDIESFADRWYAGNEPTYDGWAAPTDQINYIHNNHSMSGGFEISDEFYVSGSPDLKAFPFSRAVDPDIKSRFDLALQHLRESGGLATIFANITAAAGPAADDYPVPTEGVKAVSVACGVIYAISLAIVAVGWLLKPNEGKEPTVEEQRVKREASIAADPDAFVIMWQGKRVSLSSHMKKVVSGVLSESDPLGANIFAERPASPKESQASPATNTNQPESVHQGKDVLVTSMSEAAAGGPQQPGRPSSVDGSPSSFEAEPSDVANKPQEPIMESN